MWRITVLATFVAGGPAYPADKPELRPPYQRLLTGDDEKKAQDLRSKILRFEAEDKLEEAIQLLIELHALRQKAQGTDHYQTMDEQWDIDGLKKTAALDAAERAELSAAAKGEAEAEKLNAKGRFAETEPYYRKAWDLRRKHLGDRHPHTLVSATNLGVALRMQAKYPEAEMILREALDHRRQVLGDSHPATATAYANLGQCLEAAGKLVAAEPFHRRALEIRLNVLGPRHPDSATGCNNLAANLDARGSHSAAEKLLRQALDIYRSHHGDQHRETGIALNNLARNLETQGHLASAEVMLRQALAIFRAVGGEDNNLTAICTNNLALNLDAQMKHADAEPLHRQTLERFAEIFGKLHPNTATSCNNLGLCLSGQGKHTEAESLNRRALEIRRQALGEQHPSTAISYHNLSLCLTAQKRYADAEPVARKALEIRLLTLGGQHPACVLAWTNLAVIHHGKGESDKALDATRIATRAYEAARLRVAGRGLGRAVFGASRSPHRLFAVSLARSGKPIEAWQALEYDLARGLLDELNDRQVAALPSEKQKQLQQLNNRLEALNRQVGRLLAERRPLDEQKEALAALTASRQQAEAALYSLASEISQSSVATLDRVQAELPTDAALVIWVDQSDKAGTVQEHWACVVQSGRPPTWVRLPGSGKDSSWTEADHLLPSLFASALRHPEIPPMKFAALTQQFAAQRWAPVRPHVMGKKRLFVIPTGVMAGVPLDSLFGPDDPFVVSCLPSGTHLVRMRGRPAPRSERSLLAVGDPIYPDRQELPGTSREVRTLAALFGRSTVLTRADATVSQLESLRASNRLGEFRYLHFATHGAANRSRAFESALYLAPDQSNPEGRLTAAEVLDQWKLQADLVTLSACESGQGREGGGDGLLGFAQAFLLAGSRTILVSQWPVDDRATALLMQRFYENLLTKKMSKANALHDAKTWLRALAIDEADSLVARLPKIERGKERVRVVDGAQPAKPFSHPYYWSAFILIGDPE